MHDRELLDQLESLPSVKHSGDVWRVTPKGRNPVVGGNNGGRWSPSTGGPVLYTSLDRAGALQEIKFRLEVIDPVFPSKRPFELHRIQVATTQTIEIADLSTLGQLGVNEKKYQNTDYSQTQAIAAAAQFLEFDGIIVPSARFDCQNLVLFLDNFQDGEIVKITSTEPIDWNKI